MLVGVNGLKGAGKDTFAKMLETHSVEHPVKRLAFAYKLKIMAGRALGLGEEYDDRAIFKIMDAFKNTGVIDAQWDHGTGNPRGVHINGRQYLQWFGGEARKVFGDSFWVDQVIPADANPLIWLEHNDIITDVRYPNEAQRILELGGIVVEVIRPGLESDGHASEFPLPSDLKTHVIRNDAGLMELRGQSQLLARELGL